MTVINIHKDATYSELYASVEARVATLRKNFSRGNSADYSWRQTQLLLLKKLLIDNEHELLHALNEDLHKSETEAWTAEIGFVIKDIDHTLANLKKWMKPRKVSTPMVAQPAKSYQLPEPLGVVLIIGAWNYPLQLVLAPLVAAIAAGNYAVVKPSELAQCTSAVLARLLPRYLDRQAFLVVEGATDETSALLQQPFDHIFFTGGERVGKIVMRSAANYLTPVTLELGGKSPCIIDATADIEVAAARLVWAKWMNAGQTCTAPDYVLVDKSKAKALVSALTAQLKRFYGDDPQKSPDYGRIINQHHFKRLVSYLKDERILLGGQKDPADLYLAPTLVLEPAPNSRLLEEEIFGPILPILTVNNVDEAIALINRRPKPLAMYVFSKDKRVQQQVLTRTSAGNVAINDGFLFMINAELPFGGVGTSGMGSYHGKAGFDTFSHLKSVIARGFRFDIPLRYPPFSKIKLKWLKRLL